MSSARADYQTREAIRRHVRSYLFAHVSPAEIELRQIEAERARKWERRTIVFGDAEWIEPRRFA